MLIRLANNRRWRLMPSHLEDFDRPLYCSGHTRRKCPLTCFASRQEPLNGSLLMNSHSVRIGIHMKKLEVGTLLASEIVHISFFSSNAYSLTLEKRYCVNSPAISLLVHCIATVAVGISPQSHRLEQAGSIFRDTSGKEYHLSRDKKRLSLPSSLTIPCLSTS
jgi:hypothetical protein